MFQNQNFLSSSRATNLEHPVHRQYSRTHSLSLSFEDLSEVEGGVVVAPLVLDAALVVARVLFAGLLNRGARP